MDQVRAAKVANRIFMNYVKLQNKKVFPSKVICIGRNYVEHVHELDNEVPDEPVIFIKPNSAITNKINWCEDLHYEGELCFLMEKGQFVAVGFGIDLTKRELQSKLKSKGLPWERAKAFNASAVFSEFVKLPRDLSQFEITLHINDILKQQGHSELMIFKPEVCLASIKRDFQIEDGDIIMTGTPKGVGALSQGDKLNCSVYYKRKKLINQIWLVA